MLKKIVLFVLVLTVSVGIFGCEAEYISAKTTEVPEIKYVNNPILKNGACGDYPQVKS